MVALREEVIVSMTHRPPAVPRPGLDDPPTEEDPVRLSLREELRARLIRAIQRKKLGVEQVALRTGLHERTIQRLMSGETLRLVTLEEVAEALRINLLDDSECRPVPTDADGCGKTPKSIAVVGWRQAALVLGIHRDTLAARREEAGCSRVWPWWKDEEACRAWFDRLMEGR